MKNFKINLLKAVGVMALAVFIMVGCQKETERAIEGSVDNAPSSSLNLSIKPNVENGRLKFDSEEDLRIYYKEVDDLLKACESSEEMDAIYSYLETGYTSLRSLIENQDLQTNAKLETGGIPDFIHDEIRESTLNEYWEIQIGNDVYVYISENQQYKITLPINVALMREEDKGDDSKLNAMAQMRNLELITTGKFRQSSTSTSASQTNQNEIGIEIEGPASVTILPGSTSGSGSTGGSTTEMICEGCSLSFYDNTQVSQSFSDCLQEGSIQITSKLFKNVNCPSGVTNCLIKGTTEKFFEYEIMIDGIVVESTLGTGNVISTLDRQFVRPEGTYDVFVTLQSSDIDLDAEAVDVQTDSDDQVMLAFSSDINCKNPINASKNSGWIEDVNNNRKMWAECWYKADTWGFHFGAKTQGKKITSGNNNNGQTLAEVNCRFLHDDCTLSADKHEIDDCGWCANQTSRIYEPGMFSNGGKIDPNGTNSSGQLLTRSHHSYNDNGATLTSDLDITCQ